MKIVKSLIILIVGLGFCSCEDVFVNEIDEKEVVLIAPGDGLVTELSQLTFWWETIEDVDNYNIQIVSPSFENVAEVIVDSLTPNSSIEFSLVPNKYEWRVKAVNSISETEYSAASFEITETIVDISSKQVKLTSPADKHTTVNTDITFLWEKLQGANTYNIIIVKGSFDIVEDKILDIETADLDVSQTLTPGNYEWKVKGVNEISETGYTQYSFTIEESTE